MDRIEESPGFYFCTLPEGDNPSENAPLLSFLEQLNRFRNDILPMWREKHKENKENGSDIRESSDYYCFFGRELYAIGHIEGNYCAVEMFNSLSGLSKKIKEEIYLRDIEGIILSAFDDNLRKEILLFLVDSEYGYANGIAYDRGFIIETEPEPSS